MKFLLTMLLVSSAFAQDHAGNGGNFTDAQIAGHKATLEQTSSKIRSFLKGNPELQKNFPEFSMDEFYKRTDHIAIEVVTEEVRDTNNEKKSCINFPDLIKCDANELEKIKDNASSIFVLVFHELLGSMGLRDQFKVSDRIAAFVTKTQNYDLRVYKQEKVEIDSFIGRYILKEGEGMCPLYVGISRWENYISIGENGSATSLFKHHALRGRSQWKIGEDKWTKLTGSILPINRSFWYHITKLSLAKDGILRVYNGSAYTKNKKEIPLLRQAAWKNTKVSFQLSKLGADDLLVEAGYLKCEYSRHIVSNERK